MHAELSAHTKIDIKKKQSRSMSNQRKQRKKKGGLSSDLPKSHSKQHPAPWTSGTTKLIYTQ